LLFCNTRPSHCIERAVLADQPFVINDSVGILRRANEAFLTRLLTPSCGN
jgi:hypothetical protein